jgi:GT2 family glycosyltransferase
MASSAANTGVVVIGRNEGERLQRCLLSARAQGAPIVYVDSGSTDGSVDFARGMAVAVVDLDRSIPFTAARARNAGFERLTGTHKEIQFVMFIDGDCELVSGWLSEGRRALEADARIAVVAGRLRERNPQASLYNRLCDMEWHVPAGEVTSCGGIALVRASAFREVGGFNPQIIAGEEPELCVRLRRANWKVMRLNAEMALHDAAIFRFAQWWKRSVRAGHAYAEGAWLHGRSDRYCVRESLSAWFYGVALPAAIVASVCLTGPWGLAPAVIYPLLLARITVGRQRTHGDAWAASALYAAACIIAKPAECIGQARFWMRRAANRQPQILEYKTVTRR